MGLMDAFNADERITVKVGDLWELMDTASKAQYLENGIKAGVPVEYLWGVVTGEPVINIDFPDEDDEDLGVESLFEEKVTMYQEAEEGNMFVLTPYGMECTPEKIRAERAVDAPVKGYEHRVPVSWVEKGYVREVRDA